MVPITKTRTSHTFTNAYQKTLITLNLPLPLHISHPPHRHHLSHHHIQLSLIKTTVPGNREFGNPHTSPVSWNHTRFPEFLIKFHRIINPPTPHLLIHPRPLPRHPNAQTFVFQIRRTAPLLSILQQMNTIHAQKMNAPELIPRTETPHTPTHTQPLFQIPRFQIR